MEAWLATICLNLGRDRARRAATHTETPWDNTFDPLGPSNVESQALARIDRDTVDAALRLLPEDQRIAITLMDLCGFTAAQVATITGAPHGIVLARVHRGRKLLAHAIRQEG